MSYDENTYSAGLAAYIAGSKFDALLAKHGFTNRDNVFEAEYGGFPAAHTGNCRPRARRPVKPAPDRGSHRR